MNLQCLRTMKAITHATKHFNVPLKVKRNATFSIKQNYDLSKQESAYDLQLPSGIPEIQKKPRKTIERKIAIESSPSSKLNVYNNSGSRASENILG